MHLIQVDINYTNAIRHLKAVMGPRSLSDDSLVIKTVLTETFSGAYVRPWAVHARHGPRLVIVGYGNDEHAVLNDRRRLALPSLQAAVGEACSAEMPPIRTGEGYRFAVRMVPTVRVTPNGERRHGERDAFLVEADRAGADAGLSRDAVYARYLEDRLQGAAIASCRLDGFRLVRLARPAKHGQAQKTMPEAILSSALEVTDPAAFSECLTTGIGRQRAYGYGMLRLQPAR